MPNRTQYLCIIEIITRWNLNNLAFILNHPKCGFSRKLSENYSAATHLTWQNGCSRGVFCNVAPLVY